MQHGKKYRAVVEKLDAKKIYAVEEAFAFLKANTTAKFDESVEVHIRLKINPKKNDEQVRATLALPHGVGKVKRVVVVTSTKAPEAEKAGAELVGAENIIEDIKSGKLLAGTHFDIIVATPEMMPKLATVAKILGPKGLMPNPKNETVTTKIKETVEALKKGSKVSFKNDDSGNVHQVIGKLTFTAKQLEENCKEVIDTLRRSKPDAVKGKFITSIVVCSTMSPALKIEM
ncbi:MAG: 50S ribosomal protein L1 [Candidatus Moraniibacteriota bacterium]